MTIRFRFRLRGSDIPIEIAPAELSEAHPMLRRLRTHIHESARRTGLHGERASALADQALAGFIARCMRAFGDAYMDRVLGALTRIFDSRAAIGEQLAKLLRGETADFARVRSAFHDIDAAMGEVVAPEDAAPPRLSPHIAGAPEGVAPEVGPARTAGPAGGAAATARSVAANPLLTGMGDPTDAGVAAIRRGFRTVRRADGRTVRLSQLTDAEMRDMFPNQSSWLERLVTQEARADWAGRTTALDFAMTDPRQTLRDVARRLRETVEANGTGHQVHEGILDMSVWDYMRARLAENDPILRPAFDLLENHPHAAVRARWAEFKLSAGSNDMSGFFLGRVGDKRPDIVEVVLSHDSIHVTDATFAFEDPVHNFKTAFYRSVLERLIDVTRVTGTDYRAPFRQTGVGP